MAIPAAAWGNLDLYFCILPCCVAFQVAWMTETEASNLAMGPRPCHILDARSVGYDFGSGLATPAHIRMGAGAMSYHFVEY